MPCPRTAGITGILPHEIRVSAAPLHSECFGQADSGLQCSGLGGAVVDWVLVGASTDPLGLSQCQDLVTGALVTLCLYTDELRVVQAQQLVSFSFLVLKQSAAWQEEEELKKILKSGDL